MFELRKLVFCSERIIEKYMFKIVDSFKDETIVICDARNELQNGKWKITYDKFQKGEYNNPEIQKLTDEGMVWLKSYYDNFSINLDLNRVWNLNKKMCEEATHFYILNKFETYKEKDGSIWNKWDMFPREKFPKEELEEILEMTATEWGFMKQTSSL